MAQQELWGGTAERSVDGVAYTKIAGVKSVTVPTIKSQKRDRTSLDTVGNAKEFGKGRTEYGEFTMECFSSKAGITAAIADQARDYTWLRITLSDGTKYSAKCIVDYEVTGTDLENDAMLKLTGTVSGDVTAEVAA